MSIARSLDELNNLRRALFGGAKVAMDTGDDLTRVADVVFAHIDDAKLVRNTDEIQNFLGQYASELGDVDVFKLAGEIDFKAFNRIVTQQDNLHVIARHLDAFETGLKNGEYESLGQYMSRHGDDIAQQRPGAHKFLSSQVDRFDATIKAADEAPRVAGNTVDETAQGARGADSAAKVVDPRTSITRIQSNLGSKNTNFDLASELDNIQNSAVANDGRSFGRLSRISSIEDALLNGEKINPAAFARLHDHYVGQMGKIARSASNSGSGFGRWVKLGLGGLASVGGIGYLVSQLLTSDDLREGGVLGSGISRFSDNMDTTAAIKDGENRIIAKDWDAMLAERRAQADALRPQFNAARDNLVAQYREYIGADGAACLSDMLDEAALTGLTRGDISKSFEAIVSQEGLGGCNISDPARVENLKAAVRNLDTRLGLK